MSQSEHPGPADERPVILVIDDELGPRESLRFLLKDDYRVLCADTVDRGLQLLREQRPDTVIMDIRMPGKSGIDGLREIRKIDSELAVVMLTGFAALGTAQEAIRNEASDYMEKPFDASEMRQSVRRHVEQTRLRRKRSKLLEDADALDERIRELQAKDRLAEMGQSSAEFVHDLRNVLSLISCSSNLLRMELEELQQRQTEAPSEAYHYLDSLEDAMRQCVEMLNTWQSLIRQDPLQLTRFRAHEFVRAGVESFQPAVQVVHAQITFESLGDDCDLLADQAQLTRVLANLIQNAINAMPAQNGMIRVLSEVLDTSVRIRVSDNGCGISGENLPRIFSPNFTTRRSLGGSGLGLFIAQKIVQSHQGTVTVESSVNQGTTFILVLPRAPAVTGYGAG